MQKMQKIINYSFISCCCGQTILNCTSGSSHLRDAFSNKSVESVPLSRFLSNNTYPISSCSYMTQLENKKMQQAAYVKRIWK